MSHMLPNVYTFVYTLHMALVATPSPAYHLAGATRGTLQFLLRATTVLAVGALVGMTWLGAATVDVVNLAPGAAPNTGLRLPALDTDAFPNCTKPAAFDGIPAATVVVTSSGDIARMDFDKAWVLTHNDERADDVWVIGACAA